MGILDTDVGDLESKVSGALAAPIATPEVQAPLQIDTQGMAVPPPPPVITPGRAWIDHSSEAKGLTGLAPSLAAKVDALAQSYQAKFGEPLKITSGHRTYEHQARLYAADPNSGYVAKPGSSSHEVGEALDINKEQAARIPDTVLAELGLHRPMKGQGARGINEPWHLQESSIQPTTLAGPINYLTEAKKWNPSELKVMADQIADHYGIPKDMFRALIGHESNGWKVDAANPKSSALGLGQFLDTTSDDYNLGLKTFPRGPGGKPNPEDERLHPGKIMDAAARLLLAKKGETWADRIKAYGEGTDAYLQKVVEQWKNDQVTPPTEDDLRASAGLPVNPPPQKPLSIGQRILGNLGIGVSESVGRGIGLGELTDAAQAVGPAHGFIPPTYTPEEGLLARREAEAALMPEVGKQVLEQPATSLPGRLAEGLIRTIPELPLFYGAGEAVNVGLAGGSLLPKIGPTIGRLAEYLSPEAIKAASLMGQLPRIALHGALTGGALGAATSPPGERLSQAGEEALGFATAAPAFHIAGKVLGWAFKGALKTTPIRTFADLKDLMDNSEVNQVPGASVFETFKDVKSAFRGESQSNPNVFISRFKAEGKWKYTLSQPSGEIKPPKIDLPSTPDMPTAEKAVNLPTDTVMPSGAPVDKVRTADGLYTMVGDYSKGALAKTGWAETAEQLPMSMEEKANWMKAGQQARMNLREVLKGKNLVDEVKEAKGDVPTEAAETSMLRSDLNVGEVSEAKPATEEVKATVAPTGEVKTEVVLAGRSPEQLRVLHEINEAYPYTPNREQELVGAKALFDARAKQFEREGQGTVDDFYKQIRIESGTGPKATIVAPKGSFQAKEWQDTQDAAHIIGIGKTADFSVFIHEGWHLFERTLPQELRDALGIWRGVPYEGWNVADYEHTARAFERFWAEGHVGLKEMREIGITLKIAKIFTQFKQWLLDIYTGIKGSSIDVELNKDLENIFRKALGLKEIEEKGFKAGKELTLEKRLAALDKQSEDIIAQHDAAVEKSGADSSEVSALQDKLTAVNKEYSDLYDELHPAEKATPTAAPEPQEFYDAEGKKIRVSDETVAEAWDAANNLETRLGMDSPITQEAVQKYKDMQGELNRMEGRPDAQVLYQRSGQTDAFIQGNAEAQTHGMDEKAVDPSEQMQTAAKSEGTNHVQDIRRSGGRRILYQTAGLKPEDSEAALEQIRRSAGTTLRAQDIYRALSRDKASEIEVGNSMNIEEMLDVGEKLGMTDQIRAAKKKGDAGVFALRKDIFDTAFKFVELARKIDFNKDKTLSIGLDKVDATPTNILRLTDALKTANDAMDKWHGAIMTAKPALFNESPGQRNIRNLALWVADKMGSHPEVVDRMMWKATKALINMQNLSQRYPVLRPLFDLKVKQGRTYMEMSSSLMDGNAEKMVPGWKLDAEGKRVPTTYTAKGFESWFSLMRENPEAGQAVADILHKFDQTPGAPKLTYEGVLNLPIWEKSKYSLETRGRIAQAVADVRETFDYTYFHRKQDFLSNLPADADVVKESAKWDRDNVYHENWIPHIREGKYGLVAEDSTTGKTLYHARTDSSRELRRLEEQAKKDYPGTKVYMTTAAEPSRYGISGTGIMAFVQKISKQAEKEGLAAVDRSIAAGIEMTAAERQKIVDSYLKEAKGFEELAIRNLKAQGLRGHEIERSTPEGIPGYEQNLGTILTSYAQLYSTHVGKMEFLRNAYDELGNLKYYRNLQDYARRWVDLTTRSSDQMDRTVGTMKNLAFLRYLGGTFKAPIFHLSAKMTFVEPKMSMYTDNAKGLLARAMPDGYKFVMWAKEVNAEVVRMKEAAEAKGIPFDPKSARADARSRIASPLSPSSTEALLELKRQGVLDPQWMNVTLEQAKNNIESADRGAVDPLAAGGHYLSKGYQATLNWASMPLRVAESFGRLTTALAAHRMFEGEMKYSAAEAIEAAGRFTLDAHGYFSKANLPLWMMESTGKLAKLPMTFKLYEYHYLNLLGQLWGQGTSGKLQAAKSLAIMGAIGGVASIPFLTAANKLFRASTGVDAETWVQKQMNEMTNMPMLTDMLMYGIPGASPLGIMPALAMKSSMGEASLDDILLGAPGKMVTDSVKAAGSAISGDWDDVANKMLPAGLNNVKKAYERYTYGALGPSGNKLTEGVLGEQIKYTTPEAVAQVFGFTPAKMEKYYSQKEVMTADKQYWTDQRQHIFSQIAKAFNREDEAGMEKAFARIDAYNKKALSIGPDVQVITAQMVKQSLRDRLDKRKVLLAERLGFPLGH
jgi:hypothetical protein